MNIEQLTELLKDNKLILKGPIPENSWLTDEWNTTHRWYVERISQPYTDRHGKNAWYGKTPLDAINHYIAGNI